MTCNELLQIARKGRPDVRYTANVKQTSIGAWNDALQRFQPVAFEGLDGRWYKMPCEVLVNGQPMKREEWEVTP